MLHANKALTSLSNYKCIIDCCNIHVRRYNFASSASSFCVRTWHSCVLIIDPCVLFNPWKLMYFPSSLVSFIHFFRPACNLSLKIGIFRDLKSTISWRIKPKNVYQIWRLYFAIKWNSLSFCGFSWDEIFMTGGKCLLDPFNVAVFSGGCQKHNVRRLAAGFRRCADIYEKTV